MKSPFRNPVRLTFLALIVGVCLPWDKCGASIIAQQEYNGETTGGTPPTGTGFNSSTFTNNGIAAPGLTYSTLTTAGGARTSGPGPGQSYGTPQSSLTAGNQSSTDSYYISYLIDSTGVIGTTNSEIRKGVTVFASGFNDGDNPTDPGAKPNGATGNTGAAGGGTEVIEFGVRNGQVGYTQGNYGSLDHTFSFTSSGIQETAGTHFYVIGVTTDSSTLSSSISLYYDPTNLAVAPTQTYSTSSFHLEQLRIYGFSGVYDEIRVGDTFADVAPGLAAIPEPSTYCFLGVGSLLLFGLRRKVVKA